MSLKSIKQIPQSVKDCVYGHNRQIKTTNMMNIPSLIQTLCLLYFYEQDFIDKAHDLFKISEDKMTATKTDTGDFYRGSWCHTIFLNHWYNSMSNKIIQWKFHIGVSEYCVMAFVLITKDNGCDYNYQNHTSDENVVSTDVNEYNYAHLSSGYLKENGVGIDYIMDAMDDDYGSSQINKRSYASDDNVLHTLDLKQGEWKCKVNNNEEFLISTVMKADNINYKLTASMLYQSTSVTLTDFSWAFAK